MSDEMLRARVAESVAWCESLATDADMRSSALQPALFHEGPDDLVCDLGWNRQHQLRAKALSISSQSPVVAPGRFMLYFPDENLSDGCAELSSAGFFDVNNVPAFDTWVAFFDDAKEPGPSFGRYLLCYVPASTVAHAGDGIDVNPEECIVWLDQSSAPVRQRVEALLISARREP